jgi:hypothetical protein
MEKVERNHHFNSQHNRVTCKCEYIFPKQMGLLDLVV